MKLPAFETMGKKLVNRFFRQVPDVVWDLTSGNVGIINGDDEIATLAGDPSDPQIAINPFSDFGIPIPAFAQNVPTDQIKYGDLIFNQKRALGWVVGIPTPAVLLTAGTKKKGPATTKPTKVFKLLKADGTRGEWNPVKISSMGLDLNGAMVLRSLVNMFGGSAGLGGFQQMLMPMMMMGAMGGDEDGEEGGGMDMGKMLPMLLMMQLGLGGMNGGAPAAGGMGGMMNNPMGMMMMMPMMSSMFGGNRRIEGPGKKGMGTNGGGFFGHQQQR